MLGRAYSELPRETVESGWSEVWSLHFFALCHKMENLRLKKGAACVSKTTQRVEKLPSAVSWAPLRGLRPWICGVLDWFLGVWDHFGATDRPDIDFFNSLGGLWDTKFALSGFELLASTDM